MLLRTIGIAVILLCFHSCQQPATDKKADGNESIDTVKQTLYQYYKDIRENGLTAEINGIKPQSKLWTIIP